MIPDIENLIILYITRPQYRPIEFIRTNEYWPYHRKKACTGLFANPRAYHIIKTKPITGNNWFALTSNPNPLVLPLIIKHWVKFKKYTHCVLRNTNELIGWTIYVKYYKELITKSPELADSQYITDICSNPSDKFTKLALKLVNNSHISNNCIMGLAKNSNPLAVQFLLDNWDKILEKFNASIFAHNTNEQILNKLMDELRKKRDPGLITNVMIDLSSNPSGIYMFNKYYDMLGGLFIRPDNILKNPSDAAYYTLINKPEYLNRLDEACFSHLLLENPNELMVKFFIKNFTINNSSVYWNSFMKNPTLFEPNIEGDKYVINKIKKLLELI